jgi:hypothetical protein
VLIYSKNGGDHLNNIARVFPRKTKASPGDALAFFCEPPRDLPEISEVHVSVTFTYDLPKAEQLAESWRGVGVPVKLGGPATGQRGEDFMPGMYLKRGYVVTSRGCDNACWFCAVPKREGKTRELPITDGFNVLDDNLLSCSERHIRDVFEMLKQQKEKPVFTGGLEAKRLKPWHVALLTEVKAARMYFAYDTADDLEPLIAAGKLLNEAGITRQSRKPSCYVLIGYRGDSFDAAEKRLRETWDAGFFPFAMLYRNTDGETEQEWRRFQREWVRPVIVAAKFKESRTEVAA